MISSSMGAGKTSVLGEASDILSASGLPHAPIDFDSIATALQPDAISIDLAYRNLASIWNNCVAAGLSRILLAEALDGRGKLDRIRNAIRNAEVAVCRLIAHPATMRQRIRRRETDMLREQFVARVGALDTLLDAAHLEDFSVVNEDRSITDVASESLTRAGWMT